jgi:hypothetical protein
VRDARGYDDFLALDWAVATLATLVAYTVV